MEKEAKPQPPRPVEDEANPSIIAIMHKPLFANFVVDMGDWQDLYDVLEAALDARGNAEWNAAIEEARNTIAAAGDDDDVLLALRRTP